VAIAVVGASGDDSVSGDHGAAAGGGAEDQEFLYQVAAGEAEDSVAGDDGAAHYGDAGVSEDPNDVFLLLLDGKLRSRTETLKYLKPLAPTTTTDAASAAA
jgi:hypothetical protein